MKKKNDLIIDASTVELSHLDPGKPVCVHIGENTLVAVPERMTAMEAVNVINALTGIVTPLLDAIKEACGTCGEQMEDEGGCCPFGDTCDPDECPYADVDGPDVILSDRARKQMGIPLDAKLELLPDEGEGLVVAADYNHDITDVPGNMRALFAMAGVCPGKLDELLMDETEVWHG
ncbi:MAG: hypothetical protein K1W21_12185 [Oscillospiraceae bacterium]